MSDKTITGIVTWLRNWFYTKTEVETLISGTVPTNISITDTDLFGVFNCINNNFEDISNGNYTIGDIDDGGNISIEDTDLFSTLNCVNNNFDDLSNGNYIIE